MGSTGASFAAMLERAVKAYQNRAIETAQVIEELIGLARQMRDATRRGEELGLTDEEPVLGAASLGARRARRSAEDGRAASGKRRRP